PPSRASSATRAILYRDVVQVADVQDDPEYALAPAANVSGFRSVVSVPMFRDGNPIGVIVVTRATPGAFTTRQVDLLTTLASQAVIALENVRLFQELQTSTRELTRSVGELRALGEVGQAVSSLDLETVLTTIVSRASQLLSVDGGAIYEYDELTQEFQLRAT